MAAWASMVPMAAAEPQAISREREVHAVFLLNLTRFVRWPEAVFPAENAPLVIGVLADDPLGSVLEEAARNETAGQHPIEIRHIRSADDLEGCHAMYFPKSQMAEAVQLIPLLRSKAVLTVSDGEGFLPLGGHVQMYNRGGQVKLRLDVDNLKRAELTASAQLLRVAETVGTGGRSRSGSGSREPPLLQRFVDRDGGFGAFGRGHDGEVHAAADVAGDVQAGDSGGRVLHADDRAGVVELAAEHFGQRGFLETGGAKEKRVGG